MSPAPHIHERAIVAPGATLADDVIVGPNVVIHDDVVVGQGTEVTAGSVLLDGTRIGRRCRIGPHAVIGGTPMDRDFAGEASEVRIGDDVQVREFATVHRATGAGQATVVEDGALVMCYVHLGHNCRVGRGAILTNGSQLGGHSEVGERAVLGAGAMLHQFVRVGAYAMLGASAAANRDILPYAMSQGSPASHLRTNRVNLLRNGFEGERYKAVERALRACRRKDRDALAALAADDQPHRADVQLVIDFLDSSERGVSRFGKPTFG